MSFRSKLKLTFLSRLISMTVITVFAILVMVAVNLKGRKIEQEAPGSGLENRPALVTTLNLRAKPIEISKKYSGTIRPFERYSFSFKTAGRVVALGLNQKKEALDEGDIVRKGMVLAKLDTRLLDAQLKELEVTRDLTKFEYQQALELSQEKGAISKIEFRRRESDFQVANAKVEILKTQIEDSILRAEVDGVIAKRLVNQGESVLLGQTVFELIQVDQVKLIVGVPESKIGRMVAKFNRQEPLKVYVDLIGRNNEILQDESSTGRVRLISETSDDKSGLFEVEILLQNESGNLRPGMIAIARIVVDEFSGFQVPADAVFFRKGETAIFVVGAIDETGDLAANADDQADGVAVKYVIPENQCEMQGDFLMIKALPESARQVIVGGHRRLVDQRLIKFVEPR